MRRQPAVVRTEEVGIVFASYLVVTLLAVAFNAAAAIASVTGHQFAVGQADMLRVPRTWMRPLGTLLAAGALGLLAGFAVPVLGMLAAAGLVLYFIGAFGAHLRVHDRHLGPWAMYFSLAAAALAVNLAYHGSS